MKKPDIEYDYELELELELEVDFSKLPRDVKCIVSSNSDFYRNHIRYFSDYLSSSRRKFICYDYGIMRDSATGTTPWLYCKLHPSVEVKKEWLK